MRTARVDLLQSLLAPLVKEWGVSVVRQCLMDIESNRRGDGVDSDSATAFGGMHKQHKPSAASIAARVQLPGDHKHLVEVLAGKFDASVRSKLPTPRHSSPPHHIRPSPHQRMLPAIDRQHNAVDELGLVRREKHRRVRDVPAVTHLAGGAHGVAGAHHGVD